MWARSPEVTIDALRRVGDPTKNKSLVKGEEYDSNMVATSVAAKSQGEILASPAAADGAGPRRRSARLQQGAMAVDGALARGLEKGPSDAVAIKSSMEEGRSGGMLDSTGGAAARGIVQGGIPERSDAKATETRPLRRRGKSEPSQRGMLPKEGRTEESASPAEAAAERSSVSVARLAPGRWSQDRERGHAVGELQGLTQYQARDQFLTPMNGKGDPGEEDFA